MFRRQPCESVAKQPGYTLTELLIVIMIALLLMVVSLPTIKSVMEDARPREASRIVNATIFTAKARAAQAGNPAGIEFVYDTSAVPGSFRCTQMYMCEIPAIYAGDIVDARVSVNTSMNPWQFSFSTGSADNLNSLLDATQQFTIRINQRGPWYPVIRNGSRYEFDTNRWNRENGSTIPGGANPPRPSNSDTSGYSFQIRRQPVRVGNPVELPKSTAIDMTYSGMGPSGMEFGAANTLGLRILFSPTGNVESYTTAEPPAMMGGAPVVDTQAASGTLHFLIGLAAKVSPSGNAFDPEQSNLVDANALWVSVGRTTGIVTTNENAAAPPTSSSMLTTYLQDCRTYATDREQKGGR